MARTLKQDQTALAQDKIVTVVRNLLRVMAKGRAVTLKDDKVSLDNGQSYQISNWTTLLKEGIKELDNATHVGNLEEDGKERE